MCEQGTETTDPLPPDPITQNIDPGQPTDSQQKSETESNENDESSISKILSSLTTNQQEIKTEEITRNHQSEIKQEHIKNQLKEIISEIDQVVETEEKSANNINNNNNSLTVETKPERRPSISSETISGFKYAKPSKYYNLDIDSEKTTAVCDYPYIFNYIINFYSCSINLHDRYF